MILLTVACSGTPSNKVATLNGASNSSSSSSSGNKQSFEDGMLAYARCMRDHGVDMPDPTFDDQGHVQMSMGGGPQDKTKMEAAQTACQPIMDRAQQDAPRPSPEEEAATRDKLLAFAQCMRDHGVDMPDPSFDSNGDVGIKVTAHGGPAPNGSSSDSASSDTSAPTSHANVGGVDIDLSDPKVKAAMDACDAEGKGLGKPSTAGGEGGFGASGAGGNKG